ncbi:Erg28-like protein [Microstroma glucosiphilum]|uniref:Erg28-like protein n=1 Tax=Pseudomicrostroma glucosiphilum TaxID=1684307 RepID=A0A316U9L2_9BASI|nr:Erg28-like protein [Pseudomicrostroma glucosiphilum]PWN21852.1 Erg28-like protein [Pseudomicrostroma glucosiphilum]
MSSLHLPSTNLGRWLLAVSILAAGNTLTGLFSTASSRKSYSTNKGLSQVTPLQTRHYSFWTLTAAVVRCYAAYSITNKEVYEICMATFVIVLLHIGSEMAVYKTATLSSGGIRSTLLVATGTLAAMVMQYNHYVGK